MDVQALSFPTHSFDMIIASLIVSVVPNPEKAISEMVRVTKMMEESLYSINLCQNIKNFR